MGRFRALPLMMSLLLLAGCAGGEGERAGDALALTIRREYLDLTACTGRFAMTAESGEESFQWVMDVTYDAAAGAQLTLVEPQLVQGVTAHLDRGETHLRYGDFSLDTGPLTPDGLAPIEALPTLLSQLTGGYIAHTDLTGGVLEMTCRRDDAPAGTGLEAVLCFDAGDHTPLTGELWYDGVRVVSVRVMEFQFTTGENSG